MVDQEEGDFSQFIWITKPIIETHARVTATGSHARVTATDSKYAKQNSQTNKLNKQSEQLNINWLKHVFEALMALIQQICTCMCI